jgi:RNA recognition motif-containing protein
MPRLFVGQVPTDKAESDLQPVFEAFGQIEKLTLVRGPDGKSRGCAMVQFKRWADAERAMNEVSGTSPLEGGKGRPLVVHFANPRRIMGSQAAENAIAPRKLFVGQVRPAGSRCGRCGSRPRQPAEAVARAAPPTRRVRSVLPAWRRSPRLPARPR